MIFPRQSDRLSNSPRRNRFGLIIKADCPVAGASGASGATLNWIIVLACAAVFTGCAIQTIRLKPASPKPVSMVAALPPEPQRMAIVAQSVGVPTSRIVTVQATWNWPADMTGITAFIVRHGTNSGSYYEDFPCGLVTNLSVTFRKYLVTHDYFVVEAVSDGTRAFEPSNEDTLPKPQVQAVPIGLRIDCGQPSMVLMKTHDFRNWQYATQVFDRSCIMALEAAPTFYCTTSAPGTIPPVLTYNLVFAP